MFWVVVSLGDSARLLACVWASSGRHPAYLVRCGAIGFGGYVRVSSPPSG
jgi:hypothetical protein